MRLLRIRAVEALVRRQEDTAGFQNTLSCPYCRRLPPHAILPRSPGLRHPMSVQKVHHTARRIGLPVPANMRGNGQPRAFT